MLSPFAAADPTRRMMMGAGPMAPGQGPPSGQPNPLAGGQQDPLTALTQLLQGTNPNEQALLTTAAPGFYPGAGGASALNPGGTVLDPVIADQLQAGMPVPQNESALRLDPRMLRPDGPITQPTAMSLAGQLQAGTPAGGSLAGQLAQAPPSARLPAASSPLLQALGR